MEIVDNTFTTLRAVGKDERWLQQWLIENPSRLGLGNITIKSSELRQYGAKGGRLDVLAYRADYRHLLRNRNYAWRVRFRSWLSHVGLLGA